MLSTQLQSDHAALVKRLVKPSAEIVEKINHIKCGLMHACLGISGEVAELSVGILNSDGGNILEESGDVIFFITDLARILHREFGFTLSVYDFTEIEKHVGPLKGDYYSGVVAMTAAAGMITDVVKKHIVYSQELNLEKTGRALVALVYSTHLFLKDFGFTLDQAVQHNIDKLNRRYPEGYTDAAAKERADKPDGE